MTEPTPHPHGNGPAIERLVDTVEDLAGRWTHHQRSEARWSTIKRTALSVAALALAAGYVALYAPLFDPQATPAGPNAAVIEIGGVIQQGGETSANKLVPLISRACKNELTQALILRINSGGGSPTEAERIVAAIDRCRRDRPDLPIDALIEGTGASAAYLIAAAADRVYANGYSLVGSIGAVIATVDASEAAQRWGVTERTFVSGPLKAANGLLVPNTPEQNSAMQDVVDRVGKRFADHVAARRAERLNADWPDLFSGRIWAAEDALAAGLIDDIRVIEDHLEEAYPKLRRHNYRPSRSIHERLGLKNLIASAVREALTSGPDSLEVR